MTTTTRIALLALAGLCLANAARAGEAVALGGWVYRPGDSPVAADGSFAWLRAANDDPAWQPVTSQAPDSRGERYIWARLPLPRGDWDLPAVKVPPVWMAFQAFVGDSLVYSYGRMGGTAPENKYCVVTDHLIPLPERYAGRMLSLRVYAPKPELIGMETRGHAVYIGEADQLVAAMLDDSIEIAGLGALFVFVGLLAIALFFRRFASRNYFLLTFGAATGCLGLFYIGAQPINQLLVGVDMIRYLQRTLALVMFPIFFFWFYAQIIGARRVMIPMVVVHALFAIVALVLDLTGVVILPETFQVFNYLLIITILVSLITMIVQSKRGRHLARVMMVGFVASGVGGIIDLLQGTDAVPFWRWVSHWGVLVFVLHMAYIIEYRFSENFRRLQNYSRDLEDEVQERTRDLNDKNSALEEALTELRDTQQQLVIREKMASLGQLVAGVAHEVNTPIGAVASASDVNRRCIDIIDQEEKNATRDEKNAGRFTTAINMLRENNQVIVTAAERISRIVKSLKNFARLDEAEFQKADIHAGIDTTLTLVHHEVKGRIEIVREYGNIPPINCFPNELNQVFMNILINAAQAIEGKGTITIRTHRDEEWAYASFTDTGRGIPRDKLERIFDPGFTTKGVGVGTGLGLSISYNIIQKHGGRIDVESEVGEGSTFTVVLPI